MHSEDRLESLVEHNKSATFDKKNTLRKIVIGVITCITVGLVVVFIGKVIEEGNCFSTNEVINRILKIIRNADFDLTNVFFRDWQRSNYKELPEEIGWSSIASSGLGNGD